MKNSIGANFVAPQLASSVGNHSSKQKTQELVCFTIWQTDHRVVPLIWSDLAFQKNMFILIDM